MQSNQNKELYQKVHQETGESLSIVESIFRLQGEYTARTIRAGAFETVLLPYLGKIRTKPLAVQVRLDLMGKAKSVKLKPIKKKKK